MTTTRTHDGIDQLSTGTETASPDIACLTDAPATHETVYPPGHPSLTAARTLASFPVACGLVADFSDEQGAPIENRAIGSDSFIDHTQSLTDEQALRLARAVAAPNTDAMRIDIDNKPDSWTSLAEAIASGAAYAVCLRDGLIALDLDKSEDKDFSWAAESIRLAEKGCHIVRVSSGRPGHEHLFVLSPVGWTTYDLLLAVVPQDKRSNVRHGGARVRPPMSPHRAGGRGVLIDPIYVDQAIRLMSMRPGYRPLDQKWIRWLTGQETVEPRRLTSTGELRRGRFLYSLAIAYLNADLPFQQYRSDVENWAFPYLRAKALADASLLSTKWGEAQAYVRDHPPDDLAFSHQIDALWVVHDCEPWAGQSGSTDQLVHAALITVATLARNTREFGCAVRQLMEATGKAKSTIQSSLARLTSRGLLHRVAPASNGNSARYELIAKSVQSSPIERCSPSHKGVIGPKNGEFELGRPPDAWRTRHGLPSGTWQTYCSLPGGWFTTADAAAARPGCLTCPSVLEHLKKLHSAGLVDRNGAAGQKWIKLDKPIEYVTGLAVALGTAGATERTKAKNAAERDAYREHRTGGARSTDVGLASFAISA